MNEARSGRGVAGLRAVVIGASGYIGTNLVPRLLADGWTVRATSRNTEVLASREWDNVELMAVDILDPPSLGRGLADGDATAVVADGRSDRRRSDGDAGPDRLGHLDRLGGGRRLGGGGLGGRGRFLGLGAHDLLHREAPHACHLLRRLQAEQPVHRGLDHVVRGVAAAVGELGIERQKVLRVPALVRIHEDKVERRHLVRDQVIQAWMDAQAYRWFTFQTVTRMMQGESIGPDSSMNKVFWSEMDVRTHETALAIIGDALELDETSPSAVDAGDWMKGFQFALAGPIYAGTNEIQRNIIAERVLGLPRK